jgi:hypothetical protein
MSAIVLIALKRPYTFVVLAILILIFGGRPLSHARSGDPALICGYLGKSDAFDEAIETFSVAYADQNDKDYVALKRAI